jgi:hypothetical protein
MQNSRLDAVDRSEIGVRDGDLSAQILNGSMSLLIQSLKTIREFVALLASQNFCSVAAESMRAHHETPH